MRITRLDMAYNYFSLVSSEHFITKENWEISTSHFSQVAHSLFESSHLELKSEIKLAFALIIQLTVLRISHLSYLLNIFSE